MVQTQHPPDLETPEITSREATTVPATRQTNGTLSFLKAFLLMTTGGITLVTLLVLVGVWRAGSGFFTLIESFFKAPPATPQASVPTMVVNQIQGVSELTTAVFTMESIVPTSQDRKVGNLTVGTTRLLYIAQGEVRAGVDLSGMTASDVVVNPDTDSVVVKIPAAAILDYQLDVSQSRVYEYDRGFLNLGPDVAPQLQTLAQQKTLDKVVSAACEQGILEQARDRAEMTLEKLLTHSGYDQVTIISEVSSASQCAVK
ncbi:UNVERIFIED_CONTAM: hypothetical protein BEN50_02065 [Euhalothece sp. KZN 001]